MTSRFAYPRPARAIDTAAMRVRISLLMVEVMTLAAAGKFSAMLRTSRIMGRAYTALMGAQIHNRNLELKLHMLMTPKWRARGLSQLGGSRRLAAWMAAQKRERERPAWSVPVTAHASAPAGAADQKPAWWIEKTLKERAHRRECAKACMQPGVFKDPFRVDQEGQFRLAPFPRARRGKRARNTLSETYHYDPTPRLKLSGARSPAVIWPLEFYAGVRACAARRKAEQIARRTRPARQSGKGRRARLQRRGSRQSGITPRHAVRRYALP